MPSLVNGQCAHRWIGLGRCLELATETRELNRRTTDDDVIYDVPLCRTHAKWFDQKPARVSTAK
jgi:hypothetical protein